MSFISVLEETVRCGASVSLVQLIKEHKKFSSIKAECIHTRLSNSTHKDSSHYIREKTWPLLAIVAMVLFYFHPVLNNTAWE